MSLGSYVFRERPKPEGSSLFPALHGTGGDENQFSGVADELMPDADIIAPRGDVSARAGTKRRRCRPTSKRTPAESQ
jgi:phospholipase/carboxylesterase